MSKYKEIKTEFRSQASLLKALEDVGFPGTKIRVSPDKSRMYRLIDYHGEVRPDTASIVVPREMIGQVSNDVGFAWDGKTFQAIVSEWDSQPNVFGDKLKAITQRYAYHEVKRQARMNGYTTQEIKQGDGSIRLVLQKR